MQGGQERSDEGVERGTSGRNCEEIGGWNTTKHFYRYLHPFNKTLPTSANSSLVRQL